MYVWRTTKFEDGTEKVESRDYNLFKLLLPEDLLLTPEKLWEKNKTLENDLNFVLYATEFDKNMSKDDPYAQAARAFLFGDESKHIETVKVRIAQKGDITLDGKISAADAQRILLIYTEETVAGKEPDISSQLPNLAKRAADVNGDGKIDCEDANSVLENYVRQLAGYDACKWDDIKQILDKE